jgi:hypothetical protein
MNARLRQLRQPVPFRHLSIKEQHVRTELANDERRASRDAVLMWLRHAGAADRCELASRILTSSVYAQAALLGVVACGRCGDTGCAMCPGVIA